MARIDHAAIRTKLYEEAQRFFEDVFEMHMWREIGEKPGRKCWYKEGIQLCEVEELDAASENGYDHISIAVDSETDILAESRCQGISVNRDSGQLIVRASVHGRFRARCFRHVIEHRDLKDKCLFLHRIRICSRELRALSGRSLHVGHILVLVQVAALYIKLL